MLKNAFLFFLLLCLLFSCDKICPGFKDENYDKQFPYALNQQLVFSSSTNRQAFIRVDSVYKGDEGQLDGGKNISGCEAQAFIRLTGFLDFSGNPALGIYATRTRSKTYITLQAPFRYTPYTGEVYRSVLTSDSLKLDAETRGSSKTYPSIELNGKRFTNVQEIYLDATYSYGKQQVYKLWLAQGTGLVGYETYPTLEKWVLQ